MKIDEKKMNIFLSFIKFSIIFLLTSVVYSQDYETPSPLGPGKAPLQRELGFIVGVGPSWQSGAFNAICECPTFEGGGGLSFSLGALYQQDFSKFFQWGGIVYYSLLTNNAVTKHQEPVILEDKNGGSYPVMVQFQEELEQSFDFLFLAPFLNFTFADLFFLRLAGNFGFPLNSKVMHTKEIMQSKIRLNNGEVVDIKLEDGTSKRVIENAKLSNLTSPLVYFSPTVGVFFPVGLNTYIAGALQWNLPLTTVASRGENFKLNSWQVFIELSFALSKRKF